MFINTLLSEEDKQILLEYYKTLSNTAHITTTKPESNPPKLLSDTTESIYLIYAQHYLRRVCKLKT